MFLLLFCWFLCMSFSILVLCICFVSVLIAFILPSQYFVSLGKHLAIFYYLYYYKRWVYSNETDKKKYFDLYSTSPATSVWPIEVQIALLDSKQSAVWSVTHWAHLCFICVDGDVVERGDVLACRVFYAKKKCIFFSTDKIQLYEKIYSWGSRISGPHFSYYSRCCYIGSKWSNCHTMHNPKEGTSPH